MILFIESSLSSFKPLQFHPGLNVLLADSSSESTTGNTRNSAGKSSFVMIVDFLLGSNCDTRSLFRTPSLVNHFFRGGFLINGHTVVVQRTGSDYNKVYVLEGSELLYEFLENDAFFDHPFVNLKDWKTFLGNAFFGLPIRSTGSSFENKYSPSFRGMIKYFTRLQGDGGFVYPERNSTSQQPKSWQPALSYMFGLEWRISQDLQAVRDKEATLKSLKKAADEGVVGGVVGTVASLRPQLAIAEQKVSNKLKQIDDFEVLDSYQELSDLAAQQQRIMQEASRELVSLKETLSFLASALETESEASSVDIRTMYHAIGIELPDLALRRFEEVQKFHESVISNRRLHLRSQIEEANREVSRVNERLSIAGRVRKDALTSLQGKGAFQDLIEMQRELSKLEADVATLVNRMKAAEALEANSAELTVDRIEIQRRLQADYNTHESTLRKLILRIAELISKLYQNREGYFEVSATKNGPQFKIHIEGDRGTGIRSMEIFCIDLALFESVRERFGGPGFLIHDSHLFDGVDARQISTALLLGRESASNSEQYIVTLNSDIFETLIFPEGIDIEKAVLPTRLSDQDESGGLFGFKFD